MAGALRIDVMAHRLMELRPVPKVVEDGFSVFYHEDRLYSVRHIKSKMLSLVFASNPHEAIEMVKNIGSNTG